MVQRPCRGFRLAGGRSFGINIGLKLLNVSHLMLLAFVKVCLVDLMLTQVTVTFIVTVALLLDLPEPLIYLLLPEAELLCELKPLGTSWHLAAILLVHFAQDVHLFRFLAQPLKLLFAFAKDWVCRVLSRLILLLIVTALLITVGGGDRGHALLFDNFLFCVGVDELGIKFLRGSSADFQFL